MSDLTLALSKLQQSIVAPKDKSKQGIHFKYRNAEQILAAAKPYLGDCVILLDDEIIQVGNRIYVKSTATIRLGDESISTTALAREDEKRPSMCDAQVTGSTSSYARKYALGGLLLIDDNQDPDSIVNSQQSNQSPKLTSITPVEYWKLSEKDQRAKWQTLDQSSRNKIMETSGGN